MDEGKGTAFIILGIVAIIAIVGLVLLLTSNKPSTGNAVSSIIGCDGPGAPVTGPPGENDWLLEKYTNAGYSCEKAPGLDVYGKESWCCTPPRNVPVNQRAQTTPIGWD